MNLKSSINKICEQIVTPALKRSGWCRESQISFYKDIYFLDKRLDTEYVLYYKPNIPIAVISVTGNDTYIDMGIKTAINNAEQLDVPCAFSSNGTGFAFYNRTKGTITNISIDKFPSPDELWQIYIKYKTTNTITSKIKSEINKGFSRLLVGLLNAGVIIFRIIDNLFSTSVNKRILYLTDHEDYVKDNNANCCLNTDNWEHYRQEDTQQIPIKNHIYPKVTGNVWTNNNGNINVYYASINEFVSSDGIQTYKQYPPDFFDLVLLNLDNNKGIENNHYQEVLNHFTDIPQVAFKPQNNITQFDVEYFGDPYIVDETQLSISSDKEYTKENDVSTIESKLHINNCSDLESYQNALNINENLNHNTNNTIKVKNIINNKITVNTTIMARQTSFQHQIELAEDLKAYLVRLQENLANAAQKYHDKTNSLYEAGMMDEKHQVLEEYMFETASRIKSIVEQINESDIPFVDSWINYLEGSQSIK